MRLRQPFRTSLDVASEGLRGGAAGTALLTRTFGVTQLQEPVERRLQLESFPEAPPPIPCGIFSAIARRIRSSRHRMASSGECRVAHGPHASRWLAKRQGRVVPAVGSASLVSPARAA